MPLLPSKDLWSHVLGIFISSIVSFIWMTLSYFQKLPENILNDYDLSFEKLDEAGLRLKPGKCEFFRPQLEYLGHVVSKEGIETNPKKIAAIVNWPRPMTVTQVWSFFRVLQLLPEIYKALCSSSKTTVSTGFRG